MEIDVEKSLVPTPVIADTKQKAVTGKSFNFGHVQPKTFLSGGNYTKALTHTKNGTQTKTTTTTILTDNTMVDDLMDSLPQ